ncbi:MFS transporter [Streptosporangiaceae bacterium NEAU-GS5]|nr:MFS transporter [Streptosporangiaceae bacterium NEAU-GS5]
MLNDLRRAPVALAYAAFVLVGISAGVSGVLLPAQIDDYHVTMTTIGLTFFVFSAGFFLAGSFTGALVQRFGTRISLAIGGGAYVLSGLYMGLRPPFIGLVAIQILAGFGTGTLESVLNAYLAGLPSATTLLNRLHAFFGVGALLGPLLAAWMLGFLSWPAVWLVLAAVCLSLTAAFLAAYPRHAPAPAPDAVTPDAPDTPVEPTANGGLLAAALRSPAIVLASIFLSVYVGLEISVGNWGFTLMVDQHSASRIVAGYLVSGYWLGLTLGRFLISPFAARIGMSAARMSLACLVGVVAASVLVWLAPFAVVAGVGLVLLGFFLGPLFPTAMAVVPDLASPRLVPTAIGLMNGVSVIGGSALPWLAGALGEGIGIWTLMPYAAILGVIQVVIWRSLMSYMGRTPTGRPSDAVGPAAGA